jgi:hypothetical protein
MPTIMDHFEALTRQGLKVIPLRENSKIPLYKNWNNNWEYHWVRSKFERFPNSNIGLLLGDIVDVEGDSEEANTTILNLVKDYPHPTYRSSKSIHHLFLTPDKSLRHFRWKEIEFRGHGHQSVLPPSQTKEVTYKWLKNFKFPVPPMPHELIVFLERKRKKKLFKVEIKPGHKKVRCFTCQQEIFLHEKRHELELKAFTLLGLKWDCQDCRAMDLRPACRLIRAGVPDKIVAINGFIKE